MAGTITQSYYDIGFVKKIVFDCTADATAATFPDTILTQKIEGFLLALKTNPGAVAPTDDYDVTLVDADNIDRLGGIGADRDTSTTEVAGITLVYPVVQSDVLTLKIVNNIVNSATTQITLIYSLIK